MRTFILLEPQYHNKQCMPSLQEILAILPNTFSLSYVVRQSALPERRHPHIGGCKFGTHHSPHLA